LDLLHNEPLWMPKGSVRAILSLTVVAAWIGGAIDNTEVVLMVLAFYFGSRTAAN